MKNLSSIAAKVKYALLIICFYALCLTATAATKADIATIVGARQITAQAETQHHIWVGTDNGLFQINKSNGKFIQLTTANSVIPSNHINGICVVGDNVFAATDNGLFRFDGVSYLQLTTENSYLPANQLSSIASDERGRIFIGTQNNGLVMMENYKCETFNKTNSELTTNTVARVYMDENGLIIACLANGDYAAMGSSTMILIHAQQPATDITAVN